MKIRAAMCLLVFGLTVSRGTYGAVGDVEELIGLGGRGDVNNSTDVDSSDGIYLNNFLFNQGPQPPCMNQADVNDDGDVDISDSIYIFNWLYNGGPPPPSPGPSNPSCDSDPTSPHLGCDNYSCS